MDWMAAASNMAGDIVGTAINNRFADRRQHQAQDFSAQQYATRYQTTVQDLKAAGLNPMLAYMNGAGSSPTSSAASASESSMGTRAVNTYQQAKLTSAQEALLTSEKEKIAIEMLKIDQDRKTGAAQENNINADTLIKIGVPELNAAYLSQAMASADQAREEIRKLRVEQDQVRENIRVMEQNRAKSKSDIEVNKSIIEANSYLNTLRAAEAFLTGAQHQNTILEGVILDPKAKAAASTSGEMAAKAKNYGIIADTAWKFLGKSNQIEAPKPHK